MVLVKKPFILFFSEEEPINKNESHFPTFSLATIVSHRWRSLFELRTYTSIRRVIRSVSLVMHAPNIQHFTSAPHRREYAIGVTAPVPLDSNKLAKHTSILIFAKITYVHIV